ncbi:type VII toxin-antitoxin system HepT family RNase toxin [Sulfurimonas sp.]|uniref:type VII toxin-antitoxin system HepT family RNase toxin n=1 Tax=Sulfurimonas sp. TaxID=2022749 RepID=UPI003D0FDF34
MLHRIENKIKTIEEILTLLDQLKSDCKNKFLIDKIYQGALLHYLYMAADSSIALAEMVIKYKNLTRSQSYYESIDLLGEHGIIPADFAYDFAKIASFRNFLAHHYERIDYLEICENTLEKLEDIRKYLAYVKNALAL